METQKILIFLDQLKKNNQKAWMDENKKQYEEAKKIFEEVIQQLIANISQFDADIAGMEAKQCIFRINRDIRFSPDKTPYKINFGASMQKGGKKSQASGYYIHIQPEGESFLAGGMYMPTADILAKVRQEIDYNGAEFRKIIESENFKKQFGGLEGEKLKTAPKGYPKDHPDLDLLKFKSYIAWHKFKDEEVLAENFISKAIEVCKALKPFNDFLNKSVDN